MTKQDAIQWYAYHYSDNMDNFTTYYNTYKDWFDRNQLDPTIAHKSKQEEGNNPMFIEVDNGYTTKATACKQPHATHAAAQSVIQVIADPKRNTDEDQRVYLKERVSSIRYEKHREIGKQFFYDEPDSPKTIKELKERLKKGLYTVNEPKNYDEDDDEGEYGGHFYWRDFFSWRTADTQFDKAGYKAAIEELETFIQDIIDQIRILDPKDGLKLLEELKKWKPSKSKK
jgi:hypothetical protein